MDVLDRVYVSNNTSKTRLQWCKTSVPFPKGKIKNLEDLNQWAPPHRMYEWKILKWHFENGEKHSVAIAQLKCVVALAPGQRSEFDLVKSQGQDSFVFNPSIDSYLGELGPSLVVKAKFAGDPKEYVAYPFLLQNLKVLHSGVMGLELRVRMNFYHLSLTGNTPHKASLTTYMEVNHYDPVVKMNFVVGNDTLEMPAPGGIALESLRVECTPRLVMNVLNPQAYGILPQIGQAIQLVNGATQFSLSDGQTVSFRVNTFFKSSNGAETQGDSFYETFLAECEDPLFGFVGYDSYKKAKGLNLYQEIPQIRFTDESMARVQLEQLEGQPKVAAKATHYLGHINQVPGSTGSQPDFCSGIPYEIAAALQVKSHKILRNILTAVDREALRASYYWKNSERVSNLQYPDLFFWSSHPQNDFSWNNQYPEWRSRTNHAEGGPFNPGPKAGGFEPHDNQHISNNNLRTVYELTGDPFLGDLCHYYVSILHWDYFTDWMGHTEAERCGRTMKEALSHALLFIDTPEAQMLLPRIKQKMATTFLGEASQKKQTYGMTAVAPFNACLPQFLHLGACPTSGDPNLLAVCWQSPFHMEFLNMMIELGFEAKVAKELANMYYQDVEKYFDENGVPYTYVVLNNHANRVQGGIGITWWAGWANLAKHFEVSKRLEGLKGHIQAQMIPPPGRYLTGHDAWNSF